MLKLSTLRYRLTLLLACSLLLALAGLLVHPAQAQRVVTLANPLGQPPTVSTSNPATLITSTTATVSGNVSSEGDAPASRGISYYPTANPANVTSVASGSGLGNYSANITGLLPNTSYTAYATASNSYGTSSGATITFTTLAPDLVVSTSGQSIAAGTYNTITVQSGGSATLTGNVVVKTSVEVQDGGTLLTNCQPLTGAGTFTMADGATLGICDANGLSSTGTMSGAVQVTGVRTYSTKAVYLYNGTVAQTSGTGLPSIMRSLTLDNGAGLSLAKSITVNAYTTLTNGILTTGAYTLTLGITGSFSETATSYVTGTMQSTRPLSTAGATNNFGGMGLTLTPAASSTALPGSTLVRRVTGTALGGINSSKSIKRYFDIQPTTKAGLNVALTLRYFDSELNGITESNLHLYKSEDGGSTWRSMAGASYDASANTASLSGISSFSVWTLGDVTAPLPVQLTTFTAEAEGTGARLRWATASELGNDHFEVEASADGRTFARVGTVAGHGTTSLSHAYTFTDENLTRYAASLLYYRLRQVDFDGKATYSPVRTVGVGKSGLTLYPNPAGRTTTLSGATAGAEVQVYNVLGSLVLTTQADEAGTTALVLPQSLPGGLYLVRSGDGPALRLTVE